ncbi:helix-turn-helix transcriptional regulator [Oceanobacillus neutriphilus]|uniref:DeoR family transcriptional regulator n=1 Tax=Oceanobacillus neutriphilus TaxID=531815 RepID=A0ABQ2NUC4_9BACI|nr:metalloregulator ArsR/SmtB family transcription factor [Oceanobacillus neutriphilus]GGP10719.1 DeoR family transcriptional regulator [Oceanobacillus neutriphilus]
MNITQKTTKDKILDYLKKERSLTVSDLTDLLDMTHMAIRKHLNILERDGLIISKEVKQPVGRPSQMYSLTERGERLFPKNYEGISVEFLHDIKEMYGEEAIRTLFKRREQRLTKEYIKRIEQKSNHDKINELSKIQTEKGYMTNLSQIDENSYELIEYNCPILAVASDFKAACTCETQMFKNVLETDNVKRVCCKSDGDNYCKFMVDFNKTLSQAHK